MRSRQLEILLYLMETKKSTYAELANHFEVSKKTIMRDIDKISGMGVPVYTQSGYEGGVFLAPDYRFNRSFFTAEEIEDIILAFHIVHHLDSSIGKNSALKKLELLIPELTFLKEFDFTEYLKIELLQKPVTAHTPVCKVINTGLDDEIFLDITVAGKRYIVAPLYYILRLDGLYLYCTDENSFFTLKIEQISRCEKTSREFDRTDYLPESSKK